jgi:hypothetical protein
MPTRGRRHPLHQKAEAWSGGRLQVGTVAASDRNSGWLSIGKRRLIAFEGARRLRRRERVEIQLDDRLKRFAGGLSRVASGSASY